MNKQHSKNIVVILTALVAIFANSPAFASERFVSVYTDENASGTLKYILKSACDDAGDDAISFIPTTDSTLKITLESRLVIPQDCVGAVTIKGLDDVDTIIDGKNIEDGGIAAGDSCLIEVYSDGHSIEDLSIINNDKGGAICLFGRGNNVKGNRLGLKKDGTYGANRYGIVTSNAYMTQHPDMEGSGNTISGNTISGNTVSGIWIESDGNTIGGALFDDDKNVIEFNEIGIVLPDERSFKNNLITHNQISQNGFLGIDLADDDITPNDWHDSDTGPNKLQNSADAFQIFPLVAGSDGNPRYWAWGAATSATTLEFYYANDDDFLSGFLNAGGDEFIKDVVLATAASGSSPAITPALAFASTTEVPTFEIKPDEVILVENKAVTMTGHDLDGNTSEYSSANLIGPDTDTDGIPDSLETSTSSNNADSDGDGLSDGVEDANRNGIFESELGETDANNIDSDDDGISDWAETKGDGRYDAGIDTDPLNSDTDGDGRKDGREDKNGNGIFEIYEGETNPLSSDTDGDGVNDKDDNCPSVYNPNQEEWLCEYENSLSIKVNTQVLPIHGAFH